jgi:hypothetical protein
MSNTVIWKFTINPFVMDSSSLGKDIEVEMPVGSIILGAKKQRETIGLWAMCDLNVRKATRRFRCVPTGWKVMGTVEDNLRNLKFIDTVLLSHENYVIHVFEVLP